MARVAFQAALAVVHLKHGYLHSDAEQSGDQLREFGELGGIGYRITRCHQRTSK